MLKVYLILAARHLLKHRAYLAINLLGLAASLGICLIIWNYILYETSYNSAFNNKDRVYEVNTTLYSLEMQPYTGYDVAPTLKEAIPGVYNYVRTHWAEGRLTWKSSTGERKVFSASGIQFVDPSFFNVFDTGEESARLAGSLIPGLDEIGDNVEHRELDGSVEGRVLSFKNALLSIPSISSVSSSGVVPGGSYNLGTHMEIAGKSPEETIPGKNAAVIFSDMDFVDTYRMKIVEGRSWNAALKSDFRSVLINEAAIVPFGLGTPSEAIGQEVVFDGDTLRIIGVLKNFYWESLKVIPQHTVIWPVKVNPRRVSMLVNGSVHKTIEQVEALFCQHFPDSPFNYYFANDYYNRMYLSDIRFGKTVMCFAGFASVVALRLVVLVRD